MGALLMNLPAAVTGAGRSNPALMRAPRPVIALLVFLAGCSSGTESKPAALPQPQVSTAEAISSLCTHLQGLVLPTSQDVEIRSEPLRDDAELLRRAGEAALAGEVDDLVAVLSQEGVEVAVFVLDGITDAERRAIGERLRATPGLKDVNYETREEAAARFREMFRGFPLFLENIDVRILPESWRGLADEQDVADLGDEMRGMPGVRGVEITPIGFSQEFDELLGMHYRVCQGSGSPPGDLAG